VLIIIRSPVATYSGTCTTRPVLKRAGFERAEAEAPLMEGSVSSITSSTDLNTGARVDERLKADDFVDTVDMNRRAVSFSYVDGDEYIFMDNEDYTQFTFKQADIEDELLFITEEIQGMYVVVVDGVAVALDVPSSVELVIEETDPSIKGASASARSKPARLSTGLVVQVPEYVATGDRIIINTAERKYMSRA